MSTSNESNRPIAAVMVPKTYKELITFAGAVHNAMLDNPRFPSPNPPLSMFSANIDALVKAATLAETRAKGTVRLRDAMECKVREDLFHLCDYVQSIVETTTSPAEGAVVIESALMSVRKAPKRSIPELSARNAAVSGNVVLTAKAVASAATYYWDYSVDQSTWIPVPDTMKSRTEISGLTSARTYYFRFRALTRAGRRDYSQVVSLLVH